MVDAGHDVAVGLRTQHQTFEIASTPHGAWTPSPQSLRCPPDGDGPVDRCIHSLIAAQAARTPEAVAVAGAHETLTYGELDRQANRLAHHLQARDVGPEVLVGVLLERSPAAVVALLAVLKAGGAYLPLDPVYPTERLAFMLEDARAPVLVTTDQLVRHMRLSTPRASVVCLDREAGSIARQRETAPASTATADTLAYVIYTSGSTGEPKGVEIVHRNLLNLVQWHRRAFAVTPADRATWVTSPAFDATEWELWPQLCSGAGIYVPTAETLLVPTALRDWLVAQEITISFLPTILAESVLALEWPVSASLRVLLTGAETLRRYPSPALPFTVVNNYGPTECTVVATSGPVPPGAHPDRLPTIGRPIDNTHVYILDERLTPVPDGVIGEMYIGGAGVARGYRHRPALTAERFIPAPASATLPAEDSSRTTPGAVPGVDRLYKTGDRAYYLPDGQIAFCGRVDHQIKLRGYRIEPDEIAAALDRHDGVRASIVTAQTDGAGEQRLVAYVVPAPGVRLTTAALRDYLGVHLPAYMVPATFVLLAALPLTPHGKVDRAALPPPDAAHTLRDEPYASDASARTPIEAAVAGILATLLDLPDVGRHDNFFLLGGHSLLGAQLIARVYDQFGVDLPLRRVFEAPTVAALAAEIERLIVRSVEAMSDDDVQQLLG